MKVSELTGRELDYWVAKAEGHEVDPPIADGQPWPDREALGRKYEPNYIAFSSNWQFGGPVIERERITVAWDDIKERFYAELVHPARSDGVQRSYAVGATYLIAAMRAFVASKFGDEVV